MESISILIYIYLLLTDLLQAPWDHLQEKSLSNTDFSWFTDGFFFLTQFYFFKYKFISFNWRLIGSLVGCCLWGRTESDTTEVT